MLVSDVFFVLHFVIQEVFLFTNRLANLQHDANSSECLTKYTSIAQFTIFIPCQKDDWFK